MRERTNAAVVAAGCAVVAELLANFRNSTYGFYRRLTGHGVFIYRHLKFITRGRPLKLQGRRLENAQQSSARIQRHAFVRVFVTVRCGKVHIEFFCASGEVGAFS